MAKGIAKTIRKLEDKSGYVYKDSFENKQHSKKKKKVAVAEPVFSGEWYKNNGYSDADIRLKKAVMGAR